MNIMLRTIKKAVKWYFEKAAETYAWTPSCMIPKVNDNTIKNESV